MSSGPFCTHVSSRCPLPELDCARPPLAAGTSPGYRAGLVVAPSEGRSPLTATSRYLSAAPRAPPPSRSTFSGNVTFSYTTKDGTGLQDTASVTLVVAQPAPMSPVTFNYTAAFNKAFDGPNPLVAGITSSNPSAQLSVVGVTSKPAADVGSVTVNPDGTFVFTPASDWFGERGK